MARTLGLDVGDKRVGVALSDPSGLIASPMGVFQRSSGEAERKILELAVRYEVKQIIAGMPYRADGTESAQCQKIRNFCRRLARRIDSEMIFADEYLSTVEAQEHRGVVCHGPGSAKAGDGLDAAAACVILQRFLDQSRGGPV